MLLSTTRAPYPPKDYLEINAFTTIGLSSALSKSFAITYQFYNKYRRCSVPNITRAAWVNGNRRLPGAINHDVERNMCFPGAWAPHVTRNKPLPGSGECLATRYKCLNGAMEGAVNVNKAFAAPMEANVTRFSQRKQQIIRIISSHYKIRYYGKN